MDKIRRTWRVLRVLGRATRRALLTMRPAWQPMVFSVLVVGVTASVLATWATLGMRAGGSAWPSKGVLRVEAASVNGKAAGASATQAAIDALQDDPGYVQQSPATEPLPAWMPASVTRWEANIRTASVRYGMDPALLAIIVTVESAGDPGAQSPAGAQGLGQVVPRWHPTILEAPGPFDPDHNLDVSAQYLATLLRAYAVPGDKAEDWQTTVELAGMGYNGGPGGVTNPNSETRAYRHWIGGMWRERRDATSPTYDEWVVAGGGVLVGRAGELEGKGG